MSDNEAGKDELSKHEGWTDIKDKKRGCTDFIPLLMLIACWVAMTIVGFVACGIIEDDKLPKGDPARLLNSIDYIGRVCGSDDAVKSKPYGYYMLDKTVVCVSQCPTETAIGNYVCQDGITGSYTKVLSNECMYEVACKVLLNRCISTADVVAASKLAAIAASDSRVSLPSYGSEEDSNWFNSILSDIYDNLGVIFGVGLGLSNVIAFLYLYILRIPGILFLAIWGILLTIQFSLIAGGVLLLIEADVYKTDGVHSSSDAQALEIASYVVFAFAGLYALILLVLRKRVQLALNIVKEAARALSHMKALIFMPVFQAIGLCIFLVPWIVYCVYLASSGEMSVGTGTYYDTSGASIDYTYRTFEYSSNTKYAFLYMLFSYFWTSQFIIAIGQLTIALAVVAWYFTHNKEKVGNFTVLWSMKTITRYHVGTAAFGSLIIAIIKTIRAVLMYIQKKAKTSKNRVVQIVLMAIQCLMWCVEKCMKFLNKNAYIQTAIYGTSFCTSCRLFIPVVTTLCAYFGLVYQSGSTNGLVLPLIFVFILSYFIGCMYSEIFGMSIETILCCFIADEEMFPPELRYAEEGLRTTMQITQQEAAKNDPRVGVEPESEKLKSSSSNVEML